MFRTFLNQVKANSLLIVAVLVLVIFTGNTKKETTKEAEAVASGCCSGYNVGMNKLKKFMLDSLHGNQFEGGVYAKADLIAAINKIPGDSVYLMNVVKNCSLSQGTDLALTSPTASGVVFTRMPNCYPCPGKACCPQRACVARINRSCITYTPYTSFTGGGGDVDVLSATE